MRRIGMWIVVLALGAGLRGAGAQSAPMSMPLPAASGAATLPRAADVEVTLRTDVEEGVKELVATVTRGGKPVANARVSFGARRSFGRLVLGTDVTLDDGTAAVAFPADLPGDEKGNLELNATVEGPLSAWGAATAAVMPGGRAKAPPEENFPRALWSPNAPVGLIAAIAVLVGGAWAAYVFVGYQLMVIRKGGAS
jgi:hypothetical protein